ncbi:MAG: 2-hydroxyacyl-CoA dehydratase subunit D [Thermodesulfobacteriota bacterium]
MPRKAPTPFDALLDAPVNALAEQAIDEGRVAIGYTCSYVPAVLLSVPPLFPVRMRAPGAAGTELADIYLSNLTCSYTRSLLEFAMDFRYETLGGFIHTAGCDHMRRLHDNQNYLMNPAFSHILDIPHRTEEKGLAWYTDELKTLMEKLAAHFNVSFSPEALRAAIAEYNLLIKKILAISDLRKADTPLISGAEFHSLLMAAVTSPARLIGPRIDAFSQGLSRRPPMESARARLMVVGGQMDNPRFVETIESTGALVVADRTCTGTLFGVSPIDETENDPLAAIARHGLSAPGCPRMMEDFDRRLSRILEAAKAFRVDGIIVEYIKFCDTWGIEAASLVPALREAGYRVLSLEREYAATGLGQIQTRVQAFLESMGK